MTSALAGYVNFPKNFSLQALRDRSRSLPERRLSGANPTSSAQNRIDAYQLRSIPLFAGSATSDLRI
jgi:hypothetical protein